MMMMVMMMMPAQADAPICWASLWNSVILLHFLFILGYFLQIVSFVSHISTEWVEIVSFAHFHKWKFIQYVENKWKRIGLFPLADFPSYLFFIFEKLNDFLKKKQNYDKQMNQWSVLPLIWRPSLYWEVPEETRDHVHQQGRAGRSSIWHKH